MRRRSGTRSSGSTWNILTRRSSPTVIIPCGLETKTEIYRQYRRGEPVAELARRFYQTRTRIYRIVNDLDAARIMELPLDYIGNEQFARLRSEKEERRF